MKIFAAEKLSPNRYKTKEGYLICTNDIIARTGFQEYLGTEIGLDTSDVVKVFRPEDEVFSSSTIASFENKPLTMTHPDVNVNSENHKELSFGYVRDVHRDGDNLVCNIVVTDEAAINAIEQGEMEELSCGYDCEILLKNGQYVQHNIRGNHVALVEAGRAGNAKIRDAMVQDDDFVIKEDPHDEDGWVIVYYKNRRIMECVSRQYAQRYIRKWKKDMAAFKEEYNIHDATVQDKSINIHQLADDIFGHVVQERFSAKEIWDMIKKKDSFIWNKLARHGHTDLFDDEDELDYFCKQHKSQIFRELEQIFENEAEMAFDEEELEKIGFYDHAIQDSNVNDSVSEISSDSFGVARMYGPTSQQDIEKLAAAKQKIYFEQTYGGRSHGFWKAASTVLAEMKRGRFKIYKVYDHTIHDSKKVYYVYNEDNDYWGPFNSVAEARQKIRELKKFDKEQGNPFNEEYRIEAEIEDSCVHDAGNPATIEQLIKEEEDAIESYSKAIESAKTEAEKTVYQHIMEEEIEHVDELKKLAQLHLHDSNDLLTLLHNAWRKQNGK